MTLRKKLQITIVCLSVILCTLVTGTIAWLTDKTDPVTNTFTPSNISISLTEENKGDNYNFQMIPGKTYAKDPKVTVTTDIPCYVFVKVEENLGAWDNTGKSFADYFTYSVITGTNDWNKLADVDGVYYREVTSSGSFYVLSGNGEYINGAVTVKNTVTKADMDKLYVAGAEKPTLTFTAYAIQQEGFGTAELAWAEISKQ
jgi:hypothetical protein